MSALRIADGYAYTGPWDRDDRVQTRINADGRTFRLATVRDGRVIPWAATRTDETDVPRLWALSEISLRPSLADGESIPADLAAVVETAKRDWTRWQRDGVPLIVIRDGRGTAMRQRKVAAISYSPRVGLARE